MLAPLFALAAAAALSGAAQPADEDFTVISEDADGWSVVRRPDGCFVASSFDGSGSPTLTIFYSAERADSPLALLFSNSDWRLSDEQVADYRLEFPGSGHHWTELRGTNMAAEGEDPGLIGISFAADAVDPMLADIATAGAAELYRGATSLQGYRLAGNATAVRQLIACVRGLPGLTLPALPQAEAASAPR